MDFVLSFIKENNSVKAAKKLDIPYENVKRWYDIGKRSISPYDKFYNGIINIKHESKDTVIKRNKISKIEERLNDNLRQIQRTELTLDKHIINLKSIDLSNRKIAISALHDLEIVNKIFSDLSKRYANRNGGYTRIIKLDNRKGDDALVVILELV